MGGPRGDEESTAMDIDGASDDAAAAAAIPFPTWIPGKQVPPFVATNGPAVQLCEAIMAGTATGLPELVVSEALAVQIYRLVMNPVTLAGAAPLQGIGWGGVYRILASLARRQLVDSSTPGGLDRLRYALARKGSTSQAPDAYLLTYLRTYVLTYLLTYLLTFAYLPGAWLGRCHPLRRLTT